MAEGEKKAFNKKWLIVIAILVLIAIIVVTIILCLPGNPKSAIEALKNEENTFLLSSSKDKELYNNFKDTVSQSSVKGYNQEMEDVESVLSSLEIIIDKYEDYSIFFEENEYFYDNYKPLTESFNQLQEYKDSIKNELKKVQSYTKDSPDFLRQSWIQIRINFEKMLECYKTGLSTYNEIFKNSYFGVEQNLASILSANAVLDYITVLQQQFKILSNEDKIRQAFSAYKYNCHALVYAFNNFVSSYVLNADNALNYYFNDNIVTNYNKVNQFYSLYQQQTFQQVISSVKLSETNIISFTKTFEGIEDEEGIYNQVKAFLGGNL